MFFKFASKLFILENKCMNIWNIGSKYKKMNIENSIFTLPAWQKTLVRKTEKDKTESSLVYNTTCLKENLLPTYTNIYIHIHVYTYKTLVVLFAWLINWLIETERRFDKGSVDLLWKLVTWILLTLSLILSYYNSACSYVSS